MKVLSQIYQESKDLYRYKHCGLGLALLYAVQALFAKCYTHCEVLHLKRKWTRVENGQRIYDFRGVYALLSAI